MSFFENSVAVLFGMKSDGNAEHHKRVGTGWAMVSPEFLLKSVQASYAGIMFV